jgi:hypothetical protein
MFAYLVSLDPQKIAQLVSIPRECSLMWFDFF